MCLIVTKELIICRQKVFFCWCWLWRGTNILSYMIIFVLDYASSLCSTCILLRFASSLLSPFFFIFVPSFASLMLMFTFLCVLLIVVQILCDHVPVSTPRVAVNIALVIGSLCSVRGLYSQIYVITNYMVWCIWSFCHLFYHSCPILVSIVFLSHL